MNRSPGTKPTPILVVAVATTLGAMTIMTLSLVASQNTISDLGGTAKRRLH